MFIWEIKLLYTVKTQRQRTGIIFPIIPQSMFQFSLVTSTRSAAGKFRTYFSVMLLLTLIQI